MGDTKGGVISTNNYEPNSVFDPTLGGINEFGFFPCSSSKRILSFGIYPPTITIFDFPGLLFILQVVVVAAFARILVFLLRPLRQPKFVAEILAGVLLGPSALGTVRLPNGLPKAGTIIFQGRSFMIFDGMANLSLLYFLFLVGLNMDATAIKRAGSKGFLLAIVGLIVPFFTAIVAGHHSYKAESFFNPINVLLAIVSSVTGAPVLTLVLANTKLLHTEFGRLASSSAAVSDAFAWALFAFFCAVSNKSRQDDILPDIAQPVASIRSVVVVMIFAVALTIICFLVVRPTISWLVRQKPDDQMPSASHQSIVLAGVPVVSMAADLAGLHPVFGAFVYGLAFPDCPLATTIVDKTEGFVHAWFLPLFFAAIGLKTNTRIITSTADLHKVAVIFLASSIAKLCATTFAGLFLTTSVPAGLCLGILSSTKGVLLEIIVLYIGMDRGLLNTEALTLLVLTTTAMAAVVTPAVSLVYMPWRQLQVGCKRRNLQKLPPDAELRMLSCVHTARDVHSMIGLLSSSNPTKRCPIFVCALHLMELTSRAMNVLLVHNTNPKSNQKSGGRKGPIQSDVIIEAFESYEQHAGGISVQSITAMSPYATMHEDICTIAGDKHVPIIILPFHKEQTVGGGLEVTNPAIGSLNANVISSAPCTVGILIDRGLGATAKFAMSGQQVARHVAVIFLGGPDDREALAYAWRMGENPAISITVLRLIPGEATTSRVMSFGTEKSEARIISVEEDVERQLDEDYINDFRLMNARDETVVYEEKVVNNSEETVAAVRSVDGIHDLYIVGRGHGRTTPLTKGLEEISECPELGPIGDLLASSDLGKVASVLVMHHCFEGPSAAAAALAKSSKHQNQNVSVSGRRRDQDTSDSGSRV